MKLFKNLGIALILLLSISLNAQTLTAVKNGLVDKNNPCSICADEDEIFTGLLIEKGGLTRKVYAPFKVKIYQDTIFQLLDAYGNSARLATGAVTNYGTVDSLSNLLKTINSSPSAYKVYKAILTQATTSAPTALVLENTLDTLITWTRSDTGQYVGTLTGAFTANKTFSHNLAAKTMTPVFTTAGIVTGYYNFSRTSANAVLISVKNTLGAESDLAALAGATTSIPIYIEVYP